MMQNMMMNGMPAMPGMGNGMGMMGMMNMMNMMMGGGGGNNDMMMNMMKMMNGEGNGNGKANKNGSEDGHWNYPKNQKVWLGNLPACQSSELKEHLELAGGTVVYSAKMKGKTGVAVFTSAQQAKAAISELNGTQLGDSTIQVDVWT